MVPVQSLALYFLYYTAALARHIVEKLGVVRFIKYIDDRYSSNVLEFNVGINHALKSACFCLTVLESGSSQKYKCHEPDLYNSKPISP